MPDNEYTQNSVAESKIPPDGVSNPTNSAQQRADRLSWIMDEWIQLPGGFRIGLDGIIGLIPGIGDAGGFLISLVIINEARAAGAPFQVLARMFFNVLVETIIGAIPFIGDLFDFWFKANARNMRLLHRYLKK